MSLPYFFQKLDIIYSLFWKLINLLLLPCSKHLNSCFCIVVCVNQSSLISPSSMTLLSADLSCGQLCRKLAQGKISGQTKPQSNLMVHYLLFFKFFLLVRIENARPGGSYEGPGFVTITLTILWLLNNSVLWSQLKTSSVYNDVQHHIYCCVCIII